MLLRVLLSYRYLQCEYVSRDFTLQNLCWRSTAILLVLFVCYLFALFAGTDFDTRCCIMLVIACYSNCIRALTDSCLEAR